jgi:hypothetical protein
MRVRKRSATHVGPRQDTVETLDSTKVVANEMEVFTDITPAPLALL